MVKKRSKTALKSTETKSNEITPENEKDSLWETLWGGVGQSELPITEKQKIIFSLNKNKETGDVLLDIRVHVTGKKYTGLTSKGITVPLDKSEDFFKLVADYKKIIKDVIKNK